MKKKPTNVAASSLARLKNIADIETLDFNILLLRYLQERFIARLATSSYVDQFVLKGGFLLLAYNIERARPTKDVDFLGMGIPSARGAVEKIIREIVAVDLSDGVEFLPQLIKSEVIKEETDYEGVRVRIAARIGSARTTIQIDVGFGDIVSPQPIPMDYPTLLERGSVKVLAYSKESIVAEKFEAIVKLTTFNTRMKDFYDISFLASEFNFDSTLLQQALTNTFQRRQTPLIGAYQLLNSDFPGEPGFERLWEAFRKRSRLSTKLHLNEIWELIRSFLLPLVDAELKGMKHRWTWNRTSKTWEGFAPRAG